MNTPRKGLGGGSGGNLLNASRNWAGVVTITGVVPELIDKLTSITICVPTLLRGNEGDPSARCLCAHASVCVQRTDRIGLTAKVRRVQPPLRKCIHFDTLPL